MSLNFHGDSADWLFHDSPPVGAEPWHELHRLAERAGVSVEHLCATVETATHFTHTGKATSSPSYNDDLEEVIRALADDDYGFGFDFELETKAGWHEADHPRDEDGRFSNGGAPHLLEAADNSPSIPPPLPVNKSKAYKDLRKIHGVIADIYPGLKSRWSGKLEIKPKIDLGANGHKSWICTIAVAQEQFSNPAKMVCTMLHEALHAYSPTNFRQSQRATMWEEAVIEGAVRVYRAGMATRLGLSIDLKEFSERDRNHPYRFHVRSLERLRGLLGVTDQRRFYDDMMKLPATELEGYILDLADKLPAERKAAFDRAFLFEKKILDNEWNPVKGAPVKPKSKKEEQEKSETKAMTRDEVLFAIMHARSREAVAAAQKIRNEWVRLHPDDDEVFEASEVLEILASGYALEDDQTRTSTISSDGS